jgi:hypothetical protein
MTSIIGYTRVPFNPSCSIAPVQRLYQLDNRCNDENSRPAFHRIFSREENSQNGIIELIVDKKPLNTINLDSKMTSTIPIFQLILVASTITTSYPPLKMILLQPTLIVYKGLWIPSPN